MVTETGAGHPTPSGSLDAGGGEHKDGGLDGALSDLGEVGMGRRWIVRMSL